MTRLFFVAVLALCFQLSAARFDVVEPVDPEWYDGGSSATGDLLVSDPIAVLEVRRAFDEEPTGQESSLGTDSEMMATKVNNKNKNHNNVNINGNAFSNLSVRSRNGNKGKGIGSDLTHTEGSPLDASPEDGVTSRLVAPQDQWTSGDVHDGILLHERKDIHKPVPKEALLKDPQDPITGLTMRARGGDYNGVSNSKVPLPNDELKSNKGVLGHMGGNFAPDFTVNGKSEWSYDPTIPNKWEYGVDYHDSIDPYEHNGHTRSRDKALKDAKREHARMFHAHPITKDD